MGRSVLRNPAGRDAWNPPTIGSVCVDIRFNDQAFSEMRDVNPPLKKGRPRKNRVAQTQPSKAQTMPDGSIMQIALPERTKFIKPAILDRAVLNEVIEIGNQGVQIAAKFPDGCTGYQVRKDGKRLKGIAGELRFYVVKADDSKKRERNRKKYLRQKERLHTTARELLSEYRTRYGGEIPRPPKRQLVLSFELNWRDPLEKKRFLRSTFWRRLRLAVLERDNYTCSYCGFRTDDRHQIQVNHVDGNPENNDITNLETACIHCHAMMHAGLWAGLFGVVEIYETSVFSQVEIIQKTREMREQGHSDDEIKEALGLNSPVRWRQDLKFLEDKFGFMSSNRNMPMD